MMLTDDQLEEFKRSNTFKMLVKGSYLGVMEKEFSKMTKKQLVDECFKKEAQIFDLKDKLALTEKALELACLSLRGKCDYCKYKDDERCPLDHNCSNLVMEYFLEQAKEMMKSE